MHAKSLKTETHTFTEIESQILGATKRISDFLAMQDEKNRHLLEKLANISVREPAVEGIMVYHASKNSFFLIM